MTRNPEPATPLVGAANNRPHAVGAPGGERFEVRCQGPTGGDVRAGWTTDPTGGALVDGVNRHPSYHSPYVVDLEADR